MTPARNRVSPRGNIIAAPGRGRWMGNRGRLHEGAGTRDVVRNHRSRAWITCLLEFRGRYTRQWDPTHYTQLFFLDEAVALAAGHRPCAECRRGAYHTYRHAWQQSHGGAMPYAKEMDVVLHCERTGPSQKALWRSLPEGTFVETDDGPAVVIQDHLTVFNADTYTYGHRLAEPATDSVTVITPASNVAVLSAGYQPQIDIA
ncbi:hypothetical protein PT015_14665 [Candidatus Mycobacterium wuenschmannii]|uniref:Uncharacterized protein n=1 Tax=Candidatus Mycobacterium wuenschmannii TaxID=3027808 RepID=A0ABY8VR95_9MYCO|nr:hypothetical protein [Candidatus Mycobacterium wuenschmannii]WIM86160.1 hypothetical protein PT015_14665 [Candidatus Mycobacterium wuenschmannii]